MKEFITSQELRNSALKLARKIYMEDNFVPDIIYVSLRGGAYMGNVISEYYKKVRENQRPVLYAAVVARSYTNDMKRSQVVVDGWTYSPEYLRSGDKILLVDDIFDTGKTVNELSKIIMNKGIPRSDLKIAVYDYKVPLYKDKEPLEIQPDYYCRKHILNKPEDEKWIHYMNHEFIGLTEKEIKEHYKDKEVISILKELINL